MEHWLWPVLPERVHVPPLLNEPPAPPSLQFTLPDGVVGEPLVSVTVAVRVV